MSTSLYIKIPEASLLLSMEPEELAGVLLQIFKQRANSGLDFNLYNFLLELRQTQPYPLGNTRTGYLQQELPKIEKAVMEAVGWMLSAGLVAYSPNASSTYNVFVTRRGNKIETEEAFRDFLKASLLSQKLLHPTIADKAWPTFIRGKEKHDTAVFEAFKEVEIAVRSACDYDARIIGVDLVRKAFHPEDGPLTDKSLPLSEREALSALFAGAIGSYKNPTSHRTVAISDSVEAGEMLILASHLLRIVDDRASRIVANVHKQ